MISPQPSDAGVPTRGMETLRAQLQPIATTPAGGIKHIDCELRELAMPSSRQGRV
jgi:hypothetical protein